MARGNPHLALMITLYDRFVKPWGYVMVYVKSHPGKSLLFFFLVILFSQISFPSPILAGQSKEASGSKVLFMIAEKNIEQSHFYYWWSSSYWASSRGETRFMAEVTDISSVSTTLARAFINAGFIVVDPDAVKGEVSIEEAYRVEDLTVRSTTIFGKALDADIIIKGRAIARAGVKNPDAKLGVYMADVTAQAIRVSDGRVLASAMGHGVTRHISPTSGAIEALARAGEELAKELMEQMSAH